MESPNSNFLKVLVRRLIESSSVIPHARRLHCWRSSDHRRTRIRSGGSDRHLEPRFHEDQPERIPGPDLVDYLGIPINAEARQWA